MSKSAMIACLSLVVFLGACRKREPTVPAACPALARRTPIPPPPPPPPGPGSAEVTELLTADKLARFLGYQKEISTIAADSQLAAARQAALKKSGLDEEEVTKLGRLLVPYYARIVGLQDAMKRAEAVRQRMEEAKRAGREPDPADQAVEKGLGDPGKRLETVRREFASRYGEERLMLLAKHEADFLSLPLKMMNPAWGPAEAHRLPPPPPAPAAMPAPVAPADPKR